MPKVLSNDFSKVTEVDLIYRNKMRPSERPVIRSSSDAYFLLHSTWDKDKLELQEQFRVMLLDRKNGCLAISTMATGGVSSCDADIRLVYALALKAGASAIIIAHNHPSGNLTPSESDKTVTGRFVYAGNMLEIPLLDHIIITSEGYLSLCDQGFLEREKKPFSFEGLLPRKYSN